jgi:hypothetical protein
MLVIALHFEGGVDVGLGRGAAEDVKRVAEWVQADPLRHRLVLAAMALHQRAGVTATDEQLAALAAALEQVPANLSADPLAAVAPLGSFQGWTLRRILGAGEPGRRWIVWAMGRSWPLDPAFADALLEVARREGLAPKGDRDNEAGTP